MPSINKYNLRGKQKLRISENKSKYKERLNIFELLEAWLLKKDNSSFIAVRRDRG